MGIPSWLNGVSLGTVLATLFVVITVGALVWAMLRPVLRSARSTDATLQELRRDWFGQEGRPGFPPVPGIPQRVYAMEQALEAFRPLLQSINKEVHPNGGSSLRDQITQLTQGLENLRSTVEGDRVQTVRDLTAMRSELGTFTRALDNARTLRALAAHAEQQEPDNERAAG